MSKLGRKKIRIFSLGYFALFGIGGAVSTSITHGALIPFDLVKVRMQVGIPSIVKNSFVPLDLIRGWSPMMAGYAFHGLFRYGIYELMRYNFGKMIGKNFQFYRSLQTCAFLSSALCAEIVACSVLTPFESVKIQIQTQKGKVPRSMIKAFPLVIKDFGLRGIFKGFIPLVGRQIPCTVLQFFCFERFVDLLYTDVSLQPRSQGGMDLLGGFLTGALCAVISNPADVILSQYFAKKGVSLLHIVRNMNMEACWLGISPRIIFVGASTAFQWYIFHQIYLKRFKFLGNS